MKNLDADVASVQHSNVGFANLGNEVPHGQRYCIYFCIMTFQLASLKTKLLYTTALVVASSLIFSCQKVIDVDVPDADPQLVVEGTIRKGEKPIVVLSMSQGYFDPVDLDQFAMSGASVYVSVDGVEYELEEIPSSMLDYEQQEELSQRYKFPIEWIMFGNLPTYSVLGNSDLIGEEGKVYDLRVEYDTIVATASTKMHPTIPLDDSYFYFPENSTSDSLGIINIVYTDPDSLGNCYRWSSRRSNPYPDWHVLAGQIKDPFYIYPVGSTWDDLIINGGTFDLAAIRYPSENDNLDSLEQGLWKVGDTVLIKLETIDYNSYETLLSFETAVSSNANPFAPPTNVISHVDGGLGWWIAYSEDVDTVYCQP